MADGLIPSNVDRVYPKKAHKTAIRHMRKIRYDHKLYIEFGSITIESLEGLYGELNRT